MSDINFSMPKLTLPAEIMEETRLQIIKELSK
jgi:hypothetical protein